jgi:sulfur-carrier protein adenylyltransferase/sulfurtransferase
MNLSDDETTRYSRHLRIDEVGIEGQKRLKAARAVVVGCGGLGSPILLYLAAAGIGTLGLIDADVVDLTNLQRQVLFDTHSIGKPKADEAAKRLSALNPAINIVAHRTRIDRTNALELLINYDIIIDGSDNFATRYLLNDACVLLNKPLVYGAIYKFEGQVAVFNHQNSANYRDLFPTPPPPELAPNCAEAGVLGVLPGIIGCMQANEALKIIVGFGEPLAGKLFMIDTQTLTSRTIKISKLPDTKITELIDYEAFCQTKTTTDTKNISVETLRQWIAEGADFQLVDVREAHEYSTQDIGGTLMPLGRITDFISLINKNKPVVVHCQSGKRSQKAIEVLTSAHGFDNLLNLTGGLNAYQKSL